VRTARRSQDAHGLHDQRQREHAEQQARVVSVGVDPFVGRPDGPLDPDQAQERRRPGEQRPDPA
jgi:hypothetical protein